MLFHLRIGRVMNVYLDLQEVHCPCVVTIVLANSLHKDKEIYEVTHHRGEGYQRMSSCLYDQHPILTFSGFHMFDAR